MTNAPSVKDLLTGVHNDVELQLSQSNSLVAHATSKGDATENIWLRILSKYLPWRYQCAKAFVIDSDDNHSLQTDIVVFDRQYTPIVFDFNGALYVPAEGVYAAFEVKQDATGPHIDAAKEKVQSVRILTRTSLPVPHVQGTAPPKPLHPILGGLLCLQSGWAAPLGQHLLEKVQDENPNRCLDMVCVAKHGTVEIRGGAPTVHASTMAATDFIFRLIARLQATATVPMIDTMAYAKWLK